MRVLVTGSSGCIGAWTVKQLLDRGIEVLCFDQEADVSRLGLISGHAGSSLLKIETGKIEDTGRLKALVRDGGITHVIHLAAVLMPFCQAQPVAGGMINVIGTLNIFEAARDAGRPVRVVYASSSAVWGPEDAYGEQPLSEKDSPLPGTHYGVFKQANEGNARVFFASSGISSMGLRPWTVYGVGRDHGLTADPTLVMDLQFVEDVAESFVRCALSDTPGAHVFNLAGTIVEMNELVGVIDKLSPGAARVLSVNGPQVPVCYRMDGSALDAAVPGIPKTTVLDGIRQTLEMFARLKAENRL
jgi:nucleoside-diphosphate-sugar epimerase